MKKKKLKKMLAMKLKLISKNNSWARNKMNKTKATLRETMTHKDSQLWTSIAY